MGASLHSATGEPLRSVGTCQVSFLSNSATHVWPFRVIDDLSHPVIIGLDFLSHYGAVLDLPSGALRLPGHPDWRLNLATAAAAARAVVRAWRGQAGHGPADPPHSARARGVGVS